ncbi:type VII secretion-associated serine protease mycosin [Amycolatopsis sp. NPDC059657]|uniref:type VII secretion-associated serine protease mycosin n=1 Tax=Amycolatopsis sp. NPDC059657 TaxID=3346899 RepID=UPI00366FFACD
MKGATRRRALLMTGVMLALASVAPMTPASAQHGQRQCLPPPQLSVTGVPWAQQQLAPQRVWSLTRGAGQTVAVVDTGVDAGSGQLAGRVQQGRDVRFPGATRADSDCFGHGTFVAGIIGAAPVSSTLFAGVAPDATILPIRIADNATDTSAGALAQGIRAAVDLGAKVINVSASTNYHDPGIDAAVDFATERDALIVASAGNSAEDGNPVPYPASEPAVVAVGAVDNAGKRASFSQTGTYLSLAAPGVDISSLGPGGPGQWQASGTSYAAPFVAGVAALVRAYHPELTAAQVKHRLEATADRPPANAPDNALGWGVVNPLSAVTAILPEETATVGPPAAPVPAAHPVAPVVDPIADLLVTLGVLAVVALVAGTVLATRLGPRGTRRRWAPARQVVIADSERTSS